MLWIGYALIPGEIQDFPTMLSSDCVCSDSKVESNPHHGHAISANLGVVGRHNAIGLLLEVVLGSIILVQFLMRSILLKAPQM